MPRYVLTTAPSHSGETQYAFSHGDRIFFTYKPFHSEGHAKREAVEYLATIGIFVETTDIVVNWGGTS